MLVYGRDWWFDIINYGPRNYGGKSTSLKPYDNVVSQALDEHIRMMAMAHWTTSTSPLTNTPTPHTHTDASGSKAASSISNDMSPLDNDVRAMVAAVPNERRRHMFNFFWRLWSKNLLNLHNED
jgi:hypothetical protein